MKRTVEHEGAVVGGGGDSGRPSQEGERVGSGGGAEVAGVSSARASREDLESSQQAWKASRLTSLVSRVLAMAARYERGRGAFGGSGIGGELRALLDSEGIPAAVIETAASSRERVESIREAFEDLKLFPSVLMAAARAVRSGSRRDDLVAAINLVTERTRDRTLGRCHTTTVEEAEARPHWAQTEPGEADRYRSIARRLGAMLGVPEGGSPAEYLDAVMKYAAARAAKAVGAATRRGLATHDAMLEPFEAEPFDRDAEILSRLDRIVELLEDQARETLRAREAPQGR